MIGNMLAANLSELVNDYVLAYGGFILLIAFVAVVFLSLVIKPIVKKLINKRVIEATVCLDDYKKLLAAEEVMDVTALNATEVKIHTEKLTAYTKKISEYETVLGEKWYSDKLSQVCYIWTVVLCFIGTFIQSIIQIGGFAFLLSYGYYIYFFATVTLGEMLYAAYEDLGLKALFKLVSEKLKTTNLK